MSAAAIAWLMSTMGWLKKALEQLVELAARHPWQALCALLAVSSALLWRGEHRAQQRYELAQTTSRRPKTPRRKPPWWPIPWARPTKQHYYELAQNADLHPACGRTG